ncbi:hypothetical protein GCM10010254_25290 [Streptomyces chromofuscus]|nr:hypothetical protein GCM10010254_25290 [Streptomyces chromofuscus]
MIATHTLSGDSTSTIARVCGLIMRIEQTRCRTAYGVQAPYKKWPELRGRRPPRPAHDPNAARLRVGPAVHPVWGPM